MLNTEGHACFLKLIMKKTPAKHGKTPQWNTSHFPSWSLQLIPIYSPILASQDGTHSYFVLLQLLGKPDSKISKSFYFLKLISLGNQLFVDFWHCPFEKVYKNNEYGTKINVSSSRIHIKRHLSKVYMLTWLLLDYL